MIIRKVENDVELRAFYQITCLIYKDTPCHRSTEESIVKMLVSGPCTFHTHAQVQPSLFLHDNRIVGRCAFIYDDNLPEYVQIGFFEALPHIPELPAALIEYAREWKPHIKKLVAGLNGHLNYGAGILLDRFDQPPVFGLPYNLPYYQQYFSGFSCNTTISFRFSLTPFYQWNIEKTLSKIDTQGFTIRCMDKNKLRQEIDLYTSIDNSSFTNTRYWYWSNRKPKENFELFHPFRFLLKNENLIFVEKDGKPVGFLLWYPDFNGLVGPGQDIGIIDVLRYRFFNPLKTFRLTEVAVLPEYRKSPAVILMIQKLIPILKQEGYTTCEGGFIFEENHNSVVMTKRLLERAIGTSLAPYRKYGIFESQL